MIQPDASGLYHPKNEQDVIDLIEHAKQNKLQVRVRGAAQSAAGSVFTDDFSSGDTSGNINMELDQIRSVSIDKTTLEVTVGGGCNLGFDPFDPSGTSAQSDSNNLFFLLNQDGLAIPNVTAAIHQTVAGFISTGSSAGTMQHSFDECILSVRIIDGTGTAQTFNKSDNLNDDFYGVVVSMGLLGVITQVTLQCVPAFNIIGTETTTDDTKCQFNFFGTDNDPRQSLKDYLTQTEFARLLWWPFKTLERLISWQAKKMVETDYNADTGTPANFIPQPYHPLFPSLLGTTLPSEAVAATGFQLIATWPDWLYDILGTSPEGKSEKDQQLITLVEQIFPFLYPRFTSFYFPVNTPDHPGQKFWDNWLGSLPMDKVEFSNNLFDLQYCEMWVAADLATQAISTMEDYYGETGYSATRFYTVEILAAKKSSFWLSPAYGTDAVRINILFFKKSAIDVENYFTQFWDLFYKKNIPFRPHWGKNLPLPGSETGPAYIKSQYPKWEDFKTLRKKMDPDNIFLTSYWKAQLDLD